MSSIPPRVGSYERISHDPGHDLQGVERQGKLAGAMARERGYVIVDTYRDDDRSAYSGKPRKAYLRMLEDLRRGRIDTILAWHPDRLHRSPKELESFIDLVKETGARVVTVQGGEYDLTTAAGRGNARLVGTVARMESEHKSERLKAMVNDYRDQGRPLGKPPFGYGTRKGPDGRAEWFVIPEQRDLIQRGVKALIAGQKSVMDVLRDFQASGHFPAHTPHYQGQLRWRPRTVSALLQNPVLAGLTPQGGPGRWEAILSADEHRQVCALLRSYKRPRSVPKARSSLSSAILRCGNCGGPMSLSVASSGSPRYICRTPECGKTAILMKPLEEVMGVKIEEALKRAKGIEPETPSVVTDIETVILDLDARLGRIDDQYEMGVFKTKTAYLDKRQPVVAEREALQDRLDALQRDDVVGTAVRKLQVQGYDAAEWEGDSPERRRDLVTLLIKRIEVGPGKRGRTTLEAISDRISEPLGRVLWNF